MYVQGESLKITANLPWMVSSTPCHQRIPLVVLNYKNGALDEASIDHGG